MILTKEVRTQAENVFREAQAKGRNILFEHEVYALLNCIGLATPKFVFIKNAEDITSEMLTEFGKEIMVKIVSKDIAHKQKLGGVKKIFSYDEMFVKYVVDSMEKKVLSNFEGKEKPDIEGFLLIEAIEFRESLGYEIMMGITDDRDFGPVMTLSKGGDDAEFFAKYYDPANLFLPFLTKEESEKFAQDINIRHKFEDIGHPEYTTLMADTISALSLLAYEFSPLSKSKTKFNIETIDVNPFVITKDHKFLAIDGYAEFSQASSEDIRRVVVDNLDSLFKPKGIAVLGVSTDPNKFSLSREILQLLIDFDRDDIYCVNPKGGEVTYSGKKFVLYESLDDLPCDVDMAVYSAPAKYIPSFFSSLGKRMPKIVVLIPGMPSGIKYSEFAKQLDEVVPKGMRVVGPNCMGVYYAPDEEHEGVNTLFLDEDRLKIEYGEFSNVAMLTQSGGIAVTLIDRYLKTPLFKSILSFGNKYDVKLTDLLAYFKDEKNTKVIAMYLEGFDPLEGRMFFELAKGAEKPLILYKGGRTEEGAKAALSHTAAMTGNYEVLEAACEQSGVVLMEDVETYCDVIKGFSLLANKNFRGVNVAAVTNAGFEATIFSDELGGMKIADISEKTKERLVEINTHGLASVGTAIVDTTPMSTDKMYGEFIEALLMDDNVDCMMVSAVPHVDSLKAAPENCHDADSLANRMCDLYKKYDKPIVVSINAGDYYDDFVEIMEKAGIPVYDNVKSAARVLDTVTGWWNR